MNKVLINVPHEIKYISDWNGFTLPQEKCIINKTICGCGFTEYCLRSNLPTILCSPRKVLLENKYEQHLEDNVYLVVNSMDKTTIVDSEEKQEDIIENPEEVLSLIDSIKNYVVISGMGTYYTPKILVTYDSLRHVLKALGELGCNYINSFYYVIDEFQSIFIDSRFKASVEMNFVEYLSCLQYVTYVSATPMLDKYLEQLDEFKNLPYYELQWPADKIIKPRISRIRTRSINDSVLGIINNYLNGIFPKLVTPDKIIHESREIVFYVNSVTTICNIVKKAGLSEDQVNIVCSKCKKNEAKLRKIKMKIGEVPLKGKPHKMFTFCTRTVYLGADFYSPCASTVIVSDCNISSLSLDISLDLPQIMGRQRLEENVFKYDATVFYKSLKDEYSEKEFNEYINSKIRETNALISAYGTADIDGKRALSKQQRYFAQMRKYSDNYAGVSDKSGDLVMNKLVLLSEQRAFEVQQKTYRDDISIYNELATVSNVQEFQDEIINFFNQFETLSTFKDSLRFFCEYQFSSDEIRKLVLFRIPVEFQNYYYILGPDRCRALGYQKSKLDNEIEMINNKKSDTILSIISNSFQVSQRYTLKEIKERLGEIYSSLGLSKTPKAKDIEEYYEVKKIRFSEINNEGKRDLGYELLNLK